MSKSIAYIDLQNRSRRLLAIMPLLFIAIFAGPIGAQYSTIPIPLPAGGSSMKPVSGGAVTADSAVIFNAQVSGNSRVARWTQEGGTILLPTLGGSGSFANDVSDNGQIVGWSHTSSGDRHAFSWTVDGIILDLGTLAGNDSVASAVNENGQVVGRSSFSPSTVNYHAFIWTAADGMTDINFEQYDDDPDIVTTRSEGTAINDDGEVGAEARTIRISDGDDDEANAVRRGYFWSEPDEAILFGNSGRENNRFRPVAVTENGVIIGNQSAFDPLMFAWVAGSDVVFVNAASGGPFETEAEAVNRAGQAAVTGYFGSLSDHEYRAFSWTLADGLAALGTLGGIDDRPTGIDPDGAIVGWSRVDTPAQDRHAFIWQASTGMVDLNTLVELPEDAVLNEAQGIGPQGAIVGLTSLDEWLLLDASDTGGNDGDQDADGVPDADDRCADTVLGVTPTVGAIKNRYYSTTEGTFVDGVGRVSRISVADTGGCSEQQIIVALDLSSSNIRYGIWKKYLKRWVKFINR